MRFQVSRVMDAIERRLTTDVTLAQAVVDLGEVARFVGLDGGRPVNLLRIGMVVDALGRYLVDAGAMLYPVAARELLAEPGFTSKERMVLGRWTDDGLIEVTPVVTDRAVEIADFTGLPLIAVSNCAQYADRFPWVRTSAERVLRLVPRSGSAVLLPGGRLPDKKSGPVAIGKAAPVAPDKAAAGQTAAPEPDQAEPTTAKPDQAERGESTSGPTGQTPARATSADGATAGDDTAGEAPGDEPGDGGSRTPGDNGSPTEGARRLPEGVQTFLARGALRVSRTNVVRRRFVRAEPSGLGAALLARQWRCPEPDCPSFGDRRRLGQPVPRMRAGVPACPRHGVPVIDIGSRPPAFAVIVIVDDLVRHHFVVDDRRTVTVGRAPEDPDDVALGDWLHEAAGGWIAPEHLHLQVREGALMVVDTSDNGTLVWRRRDPDDPGETTRLRRTGYRLRDWDSVELYTGVELVLGDRRRPTVVGNAEPPSVLIDAPTVATRRPDADG